jgi:hypothetical protein
VPHDVVGDVLHDPIRIPTIERVVTLFDERDVWMLLHAHDPTPCSPVATSLAFCCRFGERDGEARLQLVHPGVAWSRE